MSVRPQSSLVLFPPLPFSILYPPASDPTCMSTRRPAWPLPVSAKQASIWETDQSCKMATRLVLFFNCILALMVNPPYPFKLSASFNTSLASFDPPKSSSNRIPKPIQFWMSSASSTQVASNLPSSLTRNPVGPGPQHTDCTAGAAANESGSNDNNFSDADPRAARCVGVSSRGAAARRALVSSSAPLPSCCCIPP